MGVFSCFKTLAQNPIAVAAVPLTRVSPAPGPRVGSVLVSVLHHRLQVVPDGLPVRVYVR